MEGPAHKQIENDNHLGNHLLYFHLLSWTNFWGFHLLWASASCWGNKCQMISPFRVMITVDFWVASRQGRPPLKSRHPWLLWREKGEGLWGEWDEGSDFSRMTQSNTSSQQPPYEFWHISKNRSLEKAVRISYLLQKATVRSPSLCSLSLFFFFFLNQTILEKSKSRCTHNWSWQEQQKPCYRCYRPSHLN